MLRIGNAGQAQGPKVGVYLYCQEHGGEIAHLAASAWRRRRAS